MRIVSAEEMAAIDRAAIHEIGIPGAVLMEKAGGMAAELIKRMFPHVKQKIIILCGPGNNGGDGFAAARRLREWGYEAVCLTFTDPGRIKGDAAIWKNVWLNLGGEIEYIEDMDRLEERLRGCGCILDALFGTGLQRPLEGRLGEAVDFINSKDIPVIGMDLPSGIDGDSGQVLGRALRCCRTLTVGLPKWGLYIDPGREYAGKVEVADIGFPEQNTLSRSLEYDQLVGFELAKSLLPPRPRSGHKGTFGTVWTLGGSSVYGGAPVLAASAVLRSGAGLSVLIGVKDMTDSLKGLYPEIMRCTLASRSGAYYDSLSLRALASRLEGLEEYGGEGGAEELAYMPAPGAICLGPGMARFEESREFVRALWLKCPLPMVIDADALRHIADICRERGESAPNPPAPRIFTPHLGELSYLMDVSIGELLKNLPEYAGECARRFGCTAAVKGAPTLISDGRRRWLNASGNPILAQGGSGDILAGLISGLLAQGMDAFEAAALGVYAHGRAGDLLAERYGNRGAQPQDICRAISLIWGLLSADENEMAEKYMDEV
ncbi:NAD(P)H-hydrate dehydratase [bacterium]|nr:NAD(P)H-hydrate dehydratase [bacterium]